MENKEEKEEMELFKRRRIRLRSLLQYSLIKDKIMFIEGCGTIRTIHIFGIPIYKKATMPQCLTNSNKS